MTYPEQARFAKQLAAELDAEFMDLDGGNGYSFCVRRGDRRFFSGAGNICSYPINSSSGYTLSRDKAHTKAALSAFGLPTIEGSHFFVSDSHVKWRNPGHESYDAEPYARSLGYPVFCKPINGARGDLAEIVRSSTELAHYMARAAKTYQAVLIERFVEGVEHRVVVHDGRSLFHITKSPPFLEGDGRRTADQLLALRNEELAGTGVSPYPPSALPLEPDDVPAAGARIPLRGRRNLSAGGEVEQVSDTVPIALNRLATEATRAVGLRLAGIDFFDLSPQQDLSRLVIIEVNGNPTLRAVERAGFQEVILQVWRSMIVEEIER
jgi:D-alanine-D-alanine ligase-like ATP-grasp enzyme